MRKSLYDYCIDQNNNELLHQWHPTLNGSTSPSSVTHGSKKKIWWRCDKGHEWQTPVDTRTRIGAGCPYCAHKKVLPGENDLASQNPKLAAQWHPVKNNELTPDQVFPHTAKKVWWICEQGHEWEAVVSSRMAGAGCPICAKRKIKQGENDLSSTHSFLAAQWHPTKNGTLSPNEVVSGSIRKVWWQCDRGHEWQASIASRAHAGNNCPVCSGRKTAPGENDLATIFSKIAQEWHPTKNGTLNPQQVTAYSNRSVWWICPLGHEYQATTAHRTNAGAGCPYCAGRKVLPGFNDLATREPVVASQWHPSLNGTLTPDQVTTGSSKKVWWECPNGHVWKAVIYSRASGKKHGCPICAGTIKPKQQKRYSATMMD